jgi:transcriptional regulator with XRE-family HTH domain
MNDRLKILRKQMKLSQQEFAAKIGMTQSSYSSLESGQTQMTERHIKPICAIFDVCEAWLKDGEGSMFMSNRQFNKIIATINLLSDENQKYIEKQIEFLLEQQKQQEQEQR